MPSRRRDTAADPALDDDPNVIVEPGTSFAKGPALLAGSILVAFGLLGLLKNSTFPEFSSSFPDGTVQGTNFLGIEVNGWTDFFSITAGALLMFGAAQHHLAKLMSLIVGLALAACAVIAIIDGQDVLGLAAANVWTKVGFAVAGGAMLVNALMPRTTRTRRIEPTATGRRRDMAAEDRAVSRDHDDDRTTVGERSRTTDDDRTTVGDRSRTTDDDRTTVGERQPAATDDDRTTVGERSRTTDDDRTAVGERRPATDDDRAATTRAPIADDDTRAPIADDRADTTRAPIAGDSEPATTRAPVANATRGRSRFWRREPVVADDPSEAGRTTPRG